MSGGKARRSAAGYRFGIVAARFNAQVTGKLLTACVEALGEQGVDKRNIRVVRVPGAFEIPLVARTMAKSNQYHAIICLGAVIRGDTPHFEYICAEVSRGVGQAALDTEIPVIFGILTTETVAQAVERADPRKFNRGGEAANVAIKMVTVMRMIEEDVRKLESRKSASRSGPAAGRTTR